MADLYKIADRDLKMAVEEFEKELRERLNTYSDLAQDEWNCRCFGRMNRIAPPMGEYEAMAAAVHRMLERGQFLGLFKKDE